MATKVMGYQRMIPVAETLEFMGSAAAMRAPHHRARRHQGSYRCRKTPSINLERDLSLY